LSAKILHKPGRKETFVETGKRGERVERKKKNEGDTVAGKSSLTKVRRWGAPCEVHNVE